MATTIETNEAEAGDGGFAALGLDAKLVKTLDELGYEEPTPIQRASIPPLIEGRDFIGQAATGTGKTAAFALPLIQRVVAMGRDRAQPAALVLVPTRELAEQVAEAVHRYGRPLHISVLPIYGGAPFGQQFRGLERGVDVVVATPGRALDHIKRQTLRLDGILTVVLDEADEMLDMGFAEDLEAILRETPAESRQTVLFSATMPPRIASITKKYLRDPVKIQIAKKPEEKGVPPKVRQVSYLVQRSYKVVALSRVLDIEDPASALVFCRTRLEVDELTEKLTARGYRAQALHGGISQELRSRVIKQLKGGKIDLVIATDVAARGLDIESLSHVINYNPPANAESYIHRIGRVGRAGREGVAITLIEPRESRLIRFFEQASRHRIERGTVPTAADLKARRLEQTRQALQATLLAGELEEYRPIVELLAAEFNPTDVAMAALKLAHAASGGDGDETDRDIPAEPVRERRDRGDERGDGRGGREAGYRPSFVREHAPADGGDRDEPARPALTKQRTVKTYRGKSPADRRDERGIVRLYFGVGGQNGLTPRDIVGAITGETKTTGADIGKVQISDFHTTVEVPESHANRIIKALNGRPMKGKKTVVRRYRENA